MQVLLIDDQRNAVFISITYGIEVTKIAKDFESGIEALKSQKWDLLLLDHDLNSYVDGIEKTGYDIMLWLEVNPVHMPSEIHLVTANPVGAARMRSVIASLQSKGLLK